MNVLAAGAEILVVEDEPLAQERIARALRHAGFQVHAQPGRAGLFERLAGGGYAAIVLDLGLPGDDGLSIARDVRLVSTVPILMLTGRAGIHERIIGLEAGADDYLVKPFAPEELVARIRALLRRAPPPARRDLVDIAVELGPARLDLRTRELAGPASRERLTEREARIVQVLARAQGPVGRAALSRAVLGREWDPVDRSLDVHLSHLRHKLQSALGQPGVLATIRSLGYELRVPARVLTEG